MSFSGHGSKMRKTWSRALLPYNEDAEGLKQLGEILLCFRINKKIPRGPPSPPAPVMHSPTRKVS